MGRWSAAKEFRSEQRRKRRHDKTMDELFIYLRLRFSSWPLFNFVCFFLLVLRSERKMPPPPCAACVQMHMCYVRYVPAEQPTPTERWSDPWLFSSSSSSFGSRSFLLLVSFIFFFSVAPCRMADRSADIFPLERISQLPFQVRRLPCWLLEIPRLLPLAGLLCSGANRLLELISLTGVAKCSLSTKSLPSASFVHSSACFGVCGRGMRNHFFLLVFELNTMATPSPPHRRGDDW